MKEGRTEGRRGLLSRLRLPATLLFVALAVCWLAFNWPAQIDVVDALQVLAATSLLMVVSILAAGWRISALTAGALAPGQGMAVNAVAQLVVLIVPSRISELAKPIGMNFLASIPLAQGMTVLALERLLDVVLLASLVLASLALLTGSYRDSLQMVGIVLGLLACTGVAALALAAARPQLLGALAQRLPWQWLRHQIETVQQSLQRISNTRSALMSAGLTIFSWAASYLIFYVFFLVLDIGQLGPGDVLIVFIVSTLGLVVSVAPGGLGTFEAAVALALGGFGIPLETAAGAAILLRICLVVPTVLCAGWYIASGQIDLPSMLKRLRQRGSQP